MIVCVFVHDLGLHLGFTVHDVVDCARRIVRQLRHLVHAVGEGGASSIDATKGASTGHLGSSAILVLISLLFLLSNEGE